MKRLFIVVILLSLLTPLAASAAGRGNVSMDLVHADLVSVLRTLTDRMGMNLVVDPSVKGEVTMTLRDVPPQKALNLVLAVAGYEYKALDHTIVVGSHDTLGRIDSMTLNRPHFVGPVKTMVITLEFARADSIAQTVKGLYPDLNVLTGPNNTIVLRGPSDELKEVHRLIKGD